MAQPVKNWCVIVGYGKGIGHGVAVQFGKQGFKVALLSRNNVSLTTGVELLKKEGIEAQAFITDAGDERKIRNTFDDIIKLGEIGVLHYNAAILEYVDPFKVDMKTILRHFSVSCGGLILSIQSALQSLEKTKGTVLVTGGGFSLDEAAKNYGQMNMSVLGANKAAQHNLVYSLSKKLSDKGIKIFELIVCGLVSDKDPKYSPEKISEEFWKLYKDGKALSLIY